MEVKENRPDACAASGTANSIYKDFSTDAPDIQEELTGPVLRQPLRLGYTRSNDRV